MPSRRCEPPRNPDHGDGGREVRRERPLSGRQRPHRSHPGARSDLLSGIVRWQDKIVVNCAPQHVRCAMSGTPCGEGRNARTSALRQVRREAGEGRNGRPSIRAKARYARGVDSYEGCLFSQSARNSRAIGPALLTRVNAGKLPPRTVMGCRPGRALRPPVLRLGDDREAARGEDDEGEQGQGRRPRRTDVDVVDRRVHTARRRWSVAPPRVAPGSSRVRGRNRVQSPGRPGAGASRRRGGQDAVGDGAEDERPTLCLPTWRA